MSSRSVSIGLLLAVLAVLPHAVHAAPVERTAMEAGALPANLIVDDVLATTVREMLAGSATFRDQCARLAGSERLRAQFRFETAPHTRGRRPRAASVIQRYEYGLIAATV